MYIKVHKYVQIFVDNIEILIEILGIRKQSGQKLHPEGSTQI